MFILTNFCFIIFETRTNINQKFNIKIKYKSKIIKININKKS